MVNISSVGDLMCLLHRGSQYFRDPDFQSDREILFYSRVMLNYLLVMDLVLPGEAEQSFFWFNNMDYQDALVLAMSQEKAAFKLYSKLAERSPNQEYKNLFLGLAQEEAKHKLRFELEYDEYVLREN